MALTVTVSIGGASSDGIILTVAVLTGASARASQTGGATSAGEIAGHSPDPPITPTQTGSWIYAAAGWAPATAIGSPVTGTTIDQSYADVIAGAVWHATNTTDGTQVFPGSSSPITTAGEYALAEILASSTIAKDASSPSPADSSAGVSVTTASFSPPSGSLLVACAAGYGGGAGIDTPAIADTASLTWTQLVIRATDGQGFAVVWVADAPSSGTSVAAAQAVAPVSAAAATRIPATRAAAAAQSLAPSEAAGVTVIRATRTAAAAQVISPASAAAASSAAPSEDAAAAQSLAPSEAAGVTVIRATRTAGGAQVISPASFATGTLPSQPVFPQAILGLEAAISLAAGQWTDITGYVYQRNSPAVRITRGRADETTQASPGTMGCQLNNRDGRFSTRNPLGAWYGQIGKNTPIRFSVPDSGACLRIEDDQSSYASCPSTSALSVTGDIDIRVDMKLSTWSGGDLAAKWVSGTEQSWLIQLNLDGTVTFYWSTTGADFPSAQSSLPLPLGRGALRVTLQVDTGDVTFYTAPDIGGSWTQLGGTAGGAGSTSVFASAAPVTVGDGCNGSFYGFGLLKGIGGGTEASPDFTAQSEGTTSFADFQGNTWTMGGTAEISARSYRGHFEMSSLPVQWDPSGGDVWVPVQGGGLLRRLQQGNAPLDSSMKRAVLSQSGNYAVHAYWPCEDLQGSTQVGSATGGPAMTVTGGTGDGTVTTAGADFAADSTFLCSNPLPQPAGSAWRGDVPSYTSHGAIIVRFLVNVTDTPGNGARIMRVITTGTCMEFSVYYGTGGALGLTGYDSGGNLVFDTGNVAFGAASQPMWVSMELRPGSGSTVDYSLETLIPGASEGTGYAGTFTGTIGNVVSVQAAPTQALQAVTLGHISVQSQWVSLYSLYQPLNAWQGETAGNRFLRLCSENSIASRVYGYPGTTAAMGAQAPETLVTLLQECETADQGMIYEPRQALALGYRTQVALLNQAAAVTLDYSAARLGDGSTPLVPADDDQYTLNDITGQRGSGSVSGSSYQQVLDDGSAMSITAPPGGVGDYATQVTLNLAADAQLPDAVGFLLHKGTVNEYRYPAIPLSLARTELAALMYAIQDVELGDCVAIENPPAWLPPDLIKQLAYQATEGLGGYIFTMAWNAVPESPYETAVLDDPVYGRADTDGSALHTGVSTTATTLSVSSADTTLPLWTTVAADFPFDIGMSGERITVTGITGTTSPQSFTVTRSVNGVVKAHLAGEAIALWTPPVLAIQ